MRTFGTIKRIGASWIIDCEPQVRIRLKRVFAQIPQGAYDKLSLADTTEVAHELLWFCDRYPMRMHHAARKYLNSRGSEYREHATAVEKILSAKYKPGNFEMAVQPRRYQSVAADLAIQTGRLLLADDVGLGKTAVGICTMMKPELLPALVVTLTHLPRQWESEINKFAPGLRVNILKKGTPYDLTRFRGKETPFPDVIISNYHKLRGWVEPLAGKVKSVIFDECQELRRNTSWKYDAAEHIAHKAKLCLGLSATPIYNYGTEMHSVLSVLAPDAIGTREEFIREWCSMGDTVRDPKALGMYLREQALMLRRTRVDVGRELPAISRIPHTIEADPEAIDQISASASELARIILTQQGTARGEKLHAAEELSWRLRQATGIAKATFVADFVRLLVDSGEKVVLYGWHHEVYAIWKDRLEDLNPVFYTGKESPTQKDKAKHAFVDGESRVLIMSLRAGAGVDGLQSVARTVVFGELDWSPGVHEQCIGRIHRDGQPEPVAAYFLIAETGSDPVVADVLGVKTAQSEGVRNPDKPLLEVSQTDPERIKKLAEEFLRQRGEDLNASASFQAA